MHLTWTRGLSISLFTLTLAACGSDDGNPGDDNGGRANGGSSTSSGGSAGNNASGSGNTSGGTASTGGTTASGGTNNSSGGTNASGGTSNGGSANGGTSNGGSAGTSNGDPNTHFVGRFEHTQNSSRFAWSGSSISTRFTGTAISAELGGNKNYFNVILDGQVQPTKFIAGARKTYELAKGLSAGTHEVTLYRLTEANQGESEFFGFKLPGGGQFEPWTAQKNRRIEVIGDSISAGYGNEKVGPNCGFKAEEENHYLTYAAIAARNLDSDLVTIAWSGKGVSSNRGTSDPDTMPVIWDRTLPEREDSTWDFAAYQPDAVVINLGTNDFVSANENWPAFKPAYLEFVKEVRSKYPNAHVFCTVGPMLYGDGLKDARQYITETVDTLTSGGDTKVHYLEFDSQKYLGCDWHPHIQEHEIMAAKLEAELKAKMGW